MSRLGEGNAKVSRDIEFSWGRKERLGGLNLDRQYYGSFTYDGLEYFLYDSVYLWAQGQLEPYIGKLIEIYETPRLAKKVKIVWYFRPTQVKQWLNGTHALNKELFLGSGLGGGLFNVNALEAIAGKCNVVCISKDERNPQASTEEVMRADYVFYRTFDVENYKFSERFPDKIAGVEVIHFFNQGKYLEMGTHPKLKGNSKATEKSYSSSKLETNDDRSGIKDDSGSGGFTNKKVLRFPTANVGRSTCFSSRASDSYHSKKRSLQDFEVNKGKNIEADTQSIKPTKIPKLDFSEWFKKQPWEDRMQKANRTGSLVLLENLDPSFISSEVEDIVLDAFKKKVCAKMIQQNAFSSPHSGQALVIFNSKDEAEFAISELKTRCLMLRDARPIVGSRPSLREPDNSSKYFGHTTIDNMKLKKHTEMRNAVSTSHYSQPNTVAFDKALEWSALQMRWKSCWDALYKQQAKEIAGLKILLKAPPSKNKNLATDDVHTRSLGDRRSNEGALSEPM